MKPVWKKIISHIVGDNTSLFVNMLVLAVMIIFIAGLSSAYIATTLSTWPEVASIGIAFNVTILVFLGVLEIIQMQRVDERDCEIKNITLKLESIQEDLTLINHKVQ